MLVTTAAGELNRKWILIAMTALMLLSLVLVAIAPNFLLLMAGRALLGICIGGFWALATAVIMRPVPAEDVPRALALMYGGQAIAAAFAAPVGSYLGGLFGWREVFWALTPIVAINLIWHAVALPSLPANQKQDLLAMSGLLRRPYFRRGLLACMLSSGLGLHDVHLSASVSRAGHAGRYYHAVVSLAASGLRRLHRHVGGRSVPQGKRRPFSEATRPRHGLRHRWTSAVWILGCCSRPLHDHLGVMNTMFSVIWMTWMSQNADDVPEAAGSLMVAAIQTSILLGAIIGGLLLDGISIEATFIGSIVLALFAIALIGNGQRLLKPETI